MNKLSHALNWREDVAGEEIIEKRNYTRTYLGFTGGVSQKELDAICEAANLYYERLGSPLRIGNGMGELLPCHVST